MTLKLNIEKLGPINDEFELELNKPITIITGDSCTGKTFILKMLGLLIKHLSTSFDIGTLEKDITSEFGHISHIVTAGEKQGCIKLYYANEHIAVLNFYAQVLEEEKRSRYRRVESVLWKGGIQPIAEYAQRSVFALDERIPIARAVLTRGQPSIYPSVNTYINTLNDLCKHNDPYLEESIRPLDAKNILPKTHSYFDKGIVRGMDAHILSASVIAFLSLAPVINRLVEGRALFAAVDTIELHLTPLLQIVATVNLARFAKLGWEKNEEQPVPLIIITHSSTVLAALAKEISKGIDDEAINISKEYKIDSNDIQTVILYRENGKFMYQIESGTVPLPAHLREYIRLI